MFGLAVPVRRLRRGRVTVRTRSGRVVNQWLLALAVNGPLLGLPVAAAWWAHHRGESTAGVWTAALVAVGVLLTLIVVLFLMAAVVRAWRDLRGRDARGPWFTTSLDGGDDGAESWRLPTMWRVTDPVSRRDGRPVDPDRPTRR